MSIILDHQLREKMAHDASAFPISYFQDELALLPNQVGPLHWHPELEIATAVSGVLEYQVGQERIMLEPVGQHPCGRQYAPQHPAAVRPCP